MPHHRIIRLFPFALSMFAQLSSSLRPFFHPWKRAGDRSRECSCRGVPAGRNPCMQCNSPRLLLPPSHSHWQLLLVGNCSSGDTEGIPGLFQTDVFVGIIYFSLSCKDLSPPARSIQSCNIKYAYFFPSQAKRKCCYFLLWFCFFFFFSILFY